MARPRSSKGHLNATLSIKLDIKTRYGLELLARKERKTLSTFIESLIETRVNDKKNGLYKEIEGKIEFSLDRLWSVNPAERLINLRRFSPELVNFEEEKILYVIANEPGFHIRRGPHSKEEKPMCKSDNPLDSFRGQCIVCTSLDLVHLGYHFDSILENWDRIVVKASGDDTVKFKKLHGISVSASHGVNYDL